MSWGMSWEALSSGVRDENRNFWERRNQPESPAHPGLRTPAASGKPDRGAPGAQRLTHFLLPRFSLFSPPFELFEGDFAFQVVDKLRAETRHVGGVDAG